MIKIIRGLAVILGLFWIGLSVLDTIGVVPHSETNPRLGERLLDSLPIAVAGVLLVFPYRFIRTAVVRIGIGAGLALVVFWMLWLSISALRDYISGAKAWQIIPTMTALLIVNILNGWAFVRITNSNRLEVASAAKTGQS